MPAPVSVGVDLVDIRRIDGALGRWGERFLQRVYSPDERSYCRSRVQELAGRFAGKEAVAKALGTGMRGVSWREIEILADSRGRPYVRLRGRARHRAEELGIVRVIISISHERDMAIAFAIAM